MPREMRLLLLILQIVIILLGAGVSMWILWRELGRKPKTVQARVLSKEEGSAGLENLVVAFQCEEKQEPLRLSCSPALFEKLEENREGVLTFLRGRVVEFIPMEELVTQNQKQENQ